MIANIPPEITLTSFSLIGILTGYIWNDQAKQIKDIRDTQKKRPCHTIHLSIIEMQNDIKWIKRNINSEKK